MTNQQTRKDFLQAGAIAGFSFILGHRGFSQASAIAQTSSTNHPNVAIIKNFGSKTSSF